MINELKTVQSNVEQLESEIVKLSEKDQLNDNDEEVESKAIKENGTRST